MNNVKILENMVNIDSVNHIEKKQITYIPIQKIILNPYQSRKNFNQDALKDLTNSIKEYGVLQPIYVRNINGIYELISGERRLIASKRAGLNEIPAIINNFKEQDCAIVSLIENVQREKFNFFEEAEGYQNLMVIFGLNTQEIAKLVCKKEIIIKNKLSLLKFSREIKKMIIENNISENHAMALLKLNHQNLQKEVLEKIIEHNFNHFQTERFIEKVMRRVSGTSIKNTQSIKGYFNDIRIFTNSIKSTVNIMKESGIKTDYTVEKNEQGYEFKIKICI